MELQVRLELPVEAQSVPVARSVLRHALEAIGAEATCVADVELAASEACTNVLDHVGERSYEVLIGVQQDTCVIEVIDRGNDGRLGHGDAHDVAALGRDAHDVASLGRDERGRGIHLMRALVDQLDFRVRSDGESGTTVHMEKHLQLRANSVAAS